MSDDPLEKQLARAASIDERLELLEHQVETLTICVALLGVLAFLLVRDLYALPEGVKHEP